MEADFGMLIVIDMLSVLLKVQSLISEVLSVFVACDSPVHSFLARLDEVQEELLYYPRHRRQQNVKVFTLKFFYVIGKALSGELSCPCDRSC